MNSAPHATFCEWSGWDFVLDDPGLVYVGQGKIPVLAFTTEAERDEAARAIADFDQSAADYKRMAGRLAEAERLLGVVTEDYYAERLRLGAPTRMPASIVSARLFLQGESKDES